MNNYEKNYNQIRVWLSSLPKPQEINFLGRRWRVDSCGVEQLSGQPADVNCKSVLVWYFTYGGVGEPNYEFLPLYKFSNGIFQSNSWMTDFSLTRENFRKVSEQMGAEFLRKERYGETYFFLVLPKIAALLTYTEADDEFPAALDIKFGSNAATFLPFETLAVLHGLITAEYKL
jgi:hypothetical protein